MLFYFKNTTNEIIMSEEDETHTNICRFSQNEITVDKIRDHCHLAVNIEVQLMNHVI